ncbi:MAG: hypothetical protein QOI19_1705, partial [Thermoleophilaceae bacterium]|nr:hypothetical protein [Thermoleophilaceae bacterium]
MEEAFGKVYAAAGDATRTDEELDGLLRDSVHAAAAKRASYSTSVREAERAYEALAGEDAPALGRSLLAEILESPREVAAPEAAPPPPPPPAPP